MVIVYLGASSLVNEVVLWSYFDIRKNAQQCIGTTCSWEQQGNVKLFPGSQDFFPAKSPLSKEVIKEYFTNKAEKSSLQSVTLC
jgi:hypothetical protein